jgi:hypothetical protein
MAAPGDSGGRSLAPARPLADVDYPGWRLAIDGEPAPIYRVNRLMRGAAVKAGRHHLVYSYEPRSFYLGRWVSVAGLVVFLTLVAFFRRHPFPVARNSEHSVEPFRAAERSAVASRGTLGNDTHPAVFRSNLMEVPQSGRAVGIASR